MIICIETSGTRCSVALTDAGQPVINRYDDTVHNHAKALAPMVDECMQYLKRHDAELDAVAVSIGPGSYTGLRIGMSLAKGICYGKKVPLIGVETLKLLATQAMFSTMIDCCDKEILFVPMIDARRMEVYTATYNMALEEIQQPRALILKPDSFEELTNTHNDAKIFIIGEGAEKYKDLCSNKSLYFKTNIRVDAVGMMPLAELALRKRDFLDLAYSTPFYLKDFQTTTQKSLQL